MKFFLTIILVSAASLNAAGLYDFDSETWLKISIKEAFISRQTTLDHRDSGSAAEFGWHLKHAGRLTTKVNDLSGTFYTPYTFNDKLRLLLVERDVFVDDLVAAVNLEKNILKYTLNKNGDFVTLEFEYFKPDAKSGKDYSAAGAGFIEKKIEDSVSFIDADFTDHYRFKSGRMLSLFVSDTPPGNIEAVSSDSLVIYPGPKTFQNVYLLQTAEGSNTLKIRGGIGRGQCNYSITALPEKGAFLKLMNSVEKRVKMSKRGSSYFALKPYAVAFLTYDKNKTMQFCRSKKSATEFYGEFCKVVERQKAFLRN